MERGQVISLTLKLKECGYIPTHISEINAENIFHYLSFEQLQFLLWSFQIINPSIGQRLVKLSLNDLGSELAVAGRQSGLSRYKTYLFPKENTEEEFQFWLRLFNVIESLEAKRPIFLAQPENIQISHDLKSNLQFRNDYLKNNLKANLDENSQWNSLDIRKEIELISLSKKNCLEELFNLINSNFNIEKLILKEQNENTDKEVILNKIRNLSQVLSTLKIDEKINKDGEMSEESKFFIDFTKNVQKLSKFVWNVNFINDNYSEVTKLRKVLQVDRINTTKKMETFEKLHQYLLSLKTL